MANFLKESYANKAHVTNIHMDTLYDQKQNTSKQTLRK